MLAVYIVTAIIGGGMVLFSALGGLHGSGDVDHGMDIGGHGGDAGHDVGGHGLAHHGHETIGEAGFWLPFFSIRFWTYLSAAFGITGLILTLLNAGAIATVLLASAVTGIASGLIAAYAFRALQVGQSSSELRMEDFLGAEAKVTVALRDSQPGKVRMSIRDDIIDMVAVSDRPIEVGEEVMVLEVDANRVVVARREDALE